eukprot:12122409-Alexandrium_andersonii.AAC.1
MGKGTGEGHGAIEAFNVWSTGLRDKSFGLVTVENSDRMPINILRERVKALPGNYMVVPLTVNCLDRTVGER